MAYEMYTIERTSSSLNVKPTNHYFDTLVMKQPETIKIKGKYSYYCPTCHTPILRGLYQCDNCKQKILWRFRK